MGLRISTNVASIGANRRLSETTNTRQRSLEKLSSGDRIVRSGDDAAGLSISDKLRAGIRSMQMAYRNTQDGISLLQTAEGGIVEAQNILIRLRELSVQAASDTIGNEERAFSNKEFQMLKDHVNKIAHTTKFDGTVLLNGLGKDLEFQIGIDNNGSADRVHFSAADANITIAALGISGVHIDTKDKARENLALLDNAINKLNMNRSHLGGIQSQLISHSQNLSIHRTNLSEGNSRVRDADFAEWTAKEMQQKILQETATAMVVQADKMSKNAVTLLEKA